MARTEVIVLRETVRESLLRDIGTAAVFIALIGIGVLLGSTALQWVGAIFGFLAVFLKVLATGAKNRMTIPEAREFLNKLEAE